MSSGLSPVVQCPSCASSSVSQNREMCTYLKLSTAVCAQKQTLQHMACVFWHPQGHMAVRLGVREDLIWIKHLLTQRMQHKCLKSKRLNKWCYFIADHQWRFIAGPKTQTWFVRQNQQFLCRLDMREKHSQCHRASFKFVVTRGQLFKTSFTEKNCFVSNIKLSNAEHVIHSVLLLLEAEVQGSIAVGLLDLKT